MMYDIKNIRSNSDHKCKMENFIIIGILKYASKINPSSIRSEITQRRKFYSYSGLSPQVRQNELRRQKHQPRNAQCLQ